MNHALTRNPDQLQDLFRTLKNPEDIAIMLEVTYRDLNYWIYRTTEPKRYATFHVPKKSGMPRRIDAPTTNVKILQQKLNQVLQSIYGSRLGVHGFVVGKSVKSNAERHIAKRWVFNVDLADFFPSINFGRVRGMFMGKPYYLPQKVATVLAHLCCFQGHLPQGAPTSPVISNMICAQMDSQLRQLAQKTRSTYTRYADDITFSTNSRRFPADIAVFNGLNQLLPGENLREIIEQNGFSINSKKIWLSGQHRRQHVTGVTVNKFPNLPRRFTSQIRAMLHAWNKYGLSAAQVEWEKSYSTKHRAPWQIPPRFEQVLKGKIEYLGMIQGQESKTYLRFLDQLGELAPNLTSGRGTPLRLLLRVYEELSNGSTTPQARGYRLEKLMNSLFEFSNIGVRQSFTRNAGGEQIDGAFEFDSWYYLVECKWLAAMTSQSDIDGLLGKLGRSGAQTMGMFISVSGWSDNVISLIKQNPEKRVLLMNGEDIRAVLTESIPLVDLLQTKARALNLDSEPFVSAADAIS